MIDRKCIFGAFCLLARLYSVAAFSVLRHPCARMGDRRLTATRTNRQRTRIRPFRLIMTLNKAQDESVTVESPSKQSAAATARSVAAHALLGEKKGQPSLQRLEADPSFKSLDDQRNRSFARLLVTTVERRLGQIDKVLEQCQSSNRSKQKVCIIRLGDDCTQVMTEKPLIIYMLPLL